ncbi:hypothetical protein BV898_11550 [Hypsibius exemplaris]|uniref:C2H2-type domain-containing protein n=1 Tax=Hypsibius exemplaris TaxID=2072580 RepID=A0A1W0WG69_HYPEX|nr:hypothetical protein BV898_11550 [Hypsibius exemplaris]
MEDAHGSQKSGVADSMEGNERPEQSPPGVKDPAESTENTSRAISTTKEQFDLSDLFAVTKTGKKNVKPKKTSVFIDVKGLGTKHKNADENQKSSKKQEYREMYRSSATAACFQYKTTTKSTDVGFENLGIFSEVFVEHRVMCISRVLRGHQTVGMEEARRTAEKEDIVDLSGLEKPFATMFPKEVMFMSSTMPEGKDTKKPKLECPCGYMSESDYEKVRHDNVCIESMKACKKISHFTCDCGNRFTGKSIWLAHRKISHGDKKSFGCPVKGCFFDAVTFCQAMEHARYHREWDARRTTQVGEILLCSVVGNTTSQSAELQSTNPILKIHKLKIVHKNGVLNRDADALIRYAVGENPSDAENVMNA